MSNVKARIDITDLESGDVTTIRTEAFSVLEVVKRAVEEGFGWKSGHGWSEINITVTPSDEQVRIWKEANES